MRDKAASTHYRSTGYDVAMENDDENRCGAQLGGSIQTGLEAIGTALDPEQLAGGRLRTRQSTGKRQEGGGDHGDSRHAEVP
jgi:hypothetical protein